jgi:hypothetical protein
MKFVRQTGLVQPLAGDRQAINGLKVAILSSPEIASSVKQSVNFQGIECFLYDAF